MNRIDKKYAELRRSGRKALIIYLTGGFPDLNTTRELVLELDGAGVDMIELGIPFSDPIADGPVIQYSSQKALEKGATVRKLLKMVSGLKGKVQAPLLVMSYLNPLYKYGLKEFFRDAAKAGIDGVIIPDLIIEEGKDISALAAASGLDLVYFISPTSGKKRIAASAKRSRGFVYAVSVAGTTGAVKKFPASTRKFLEEARKLTDKPVSLGFGISRPGQLKAVGKSVDGFIVGSAFIRLIMNTKRRRLMQETRKFIAGFKR